MKKSAISILARYRVAVPSAVLELLDRTHDPVRIGGTRYARFTWHGVPGRLCDVIIAEAVLHRPAQASAEAVLEISDMRPHVLPPALQDVVLEVGEKAGKYDGQVRRRYALRRFQRKDIDGIPRADIRVISDDAEMMIVIRPHIGGGAPIVDTFCRLRGNLDGYDMSRIIGWHWRRYFRHLTDDDQIREFADSWEAEVAASGEAASWTLAEANRAASRALYRLSRSLGWSKLTAEERARLGLPADAEQWQHERDLIPLYALRGDPEGWHPTGCGEATLRAASGGSFEHWGYGRNEEPLTAGETLAMALEFSE